MTTNRADVLIIGGGIMGTATAFFLRRRGLSVNLLERDLVGQAASVASFGNARRQGRFLPQLPLANRSRALWGGIDRLLETDVEFRATGHIRVAFEEAEAHKLETYAGNCAPYGLSLELLRGNAMRGKFPFLAPDALMVSHSPQDGHANPRLVAPAFARAATRAGARIVEHAEVLGITRDGTDFVVEARGAGTFRAPLLQVSAGAWGRTLARQMGEDVPLEAESPQMAVTEPMPYRFTPVMGLGSAIKDGGMYLRQVERGNIVFGGGRHSTADLVTKRAQVDPLTTLQQLPRLTRLLPAAANLRIIRSWSGVEGYLRDDLPVMGPSSVTSGLFYAFGFCGHGFQLSPGVGDCMAKLLATGACSTPLEPFHISRFAAAAA